MKLSQAIAYVAAQNESIAKRITHSGLRISIEHPRGTTRLLKDDEGKVVWKKYMHHDYGFFENTDGRDGDEVDVMMGPLTNPDDVFIIHMIDKGPDVDEREDEDKVMLGFPNADAAKVAFHLHYPENFYGGMTVLPMKLFKKRLAHAQKPYTNRKLTARM
jgi:hypothetical protein